MHRVSCVVLLLSIVVPVARAEVRLPHVLSDHMVLQRDKPIDIWGWADAGEAVEVSLEGDVVKTTADEQGSWQVHLPARDAGGPFELTVRASNTVTLNDVLVGEVWFCSGQSNMALGVTKTNNEAEEIAAADYPRIRLFTTREKYAKEPQTDVEADWLVCSPKTVGYFSATAYYFGREIHHELDVPVGLVVSAVNGTRIEPWTPANGVRAIGELKGIDEPVDGELYNGMIHPFTPMTIRGFLWYQGEGNVGDGMTYYHRQRALISGWRSAWQQDDLPFYFVQLTPLDWGGKPKHLHAEVWQAQLATLAVPHTGMAVTTDIVGHVGEAHPRNKQEVGRRLSLWALAKTYGRDDLVYSGPLYRSVKREGNKLRVTFDHAEGGLASRDGEPLSWLTIGGDDDNFVPAKAKVEGNTLIVWADEVTAPVEVRLGWFQTAEPNLINKEGLPASPFRGRVE